MSVRLFLRRLAITAALFGGVSGTEVWAAPPVAEEPSPLVYADAG